MIRRIVALLAACAAAPYLTMLLLIVDPSFDGPGVETPLDLLKAIPVGTLALLFLGLPLLCAAKVLAIVLHLCGWEARWHIVLAACLLGACFVGLTFSKEWKRTLAPLLEGGLAGAVCGWIYWRIGIRSHQFAIARQS